MFSKIMIFLIKLQKDLTSAIQYIYKTAYPNKKIFCIVSGVVIGISMLLSLINNDINLIILNTMYVLCIIILIYGFVALLNNAISSVRYNLLTIFIVAGGVDYFIGALNYEIEWIWMYGMVCVLLSLLVDCDVAKVSNRILLAVFSVVAFILNKSYITDKSMLFTQEQLEGYNELGSEGLAQFEELLVNNPEILNNTLKNVFVSEALNSIAPIVLIWVITRMLIESKEYAIKKYTAKE